MSCRHLIMAAVCLICLTIVVLAGSTGHIRGRITDKETNEPIVGASVVLVGTKHGALTDPDGNYAICHLEPGTYTVKITSVDYNTIEVKGVPVKEGEGTEVNQKLEKKVAQLDKTITVTAEREGAVQKYETQNHATITSQTIKTKPVQNTDQCLRERAGVQSTTPDRVVIRDGRAGAEEKVVKQPPCPEQYYEAPRRRVRGPSHGGTAIVNGQPFDAMFFKDYGSNPFVDTEDDHLSTFAIDVDDASYIMTRSHLQQGALPPAEAVRVEEFINHFTYDYPAPDHDPFSITTVGGPSLFGSSNVRLLQVGIQGLGGCSIRRRPLDVILVVDVSGSMQIDNRLELVKQALLMLVDELQSADWVTIVTYGSSANIPLARTPVIERGAIREVIKSLRPGGSTNAEDGLFWGYLYADDVAKRGRQARLILCSDGVANVGVTAAEELLQQASEYAKKGVTLTTVGFGMDNYNDVLLEQLGDKGNGHYAYVDDLEEAHRVFVKNLGGTLQVIARDVKIQVEFDPSVVRSYRLLGYENRDVADVDFRNDTVDGGEIGAGHQVTALYELKLKSCSGRRPLGSVSVRYTDAAMSTVREVKKSIDMTVFSQQSAGVDESLRLAAAAAQFAEILRNSYWAKEESLEDVLILARDLYDETENHEVLEFVGLVQRAMELQNQMAKR